MEYFFVATNVRFLLIIVLPFWLFHGVGSVVILVIALSLFAHLKVNCGFWKGWGNRGCFGSDVGSGCFEYVRGMEDEECVKETRD